MAYNSPTDVPSLSLDLQTPQTQNKRAGKTVVPAGKTTWGPRTAQKKRTAQLSLAASSARRSTRLNSREGSVVSSSRGSCSVGIRKENPLSQNSEPFSRYTQCFFCRQGGDIIVCSSCQSFAACIATTVLPGCIDSDYATPWRCPPCHKKESIVTPYPIPSRSIGGCPFGMSKDPLVIYNITLENGEAFNIHEASATFLEDVARSRFIGKPEELLIVKLPFSDLAAPIVSSLVKKNLARLGAFLSRGNVRLVVTLNTHANPEHGGLLYGAGKFTGLDMILDRVFKGISLKLFSNSLLFVISCGGFITHALPELQHAGLSFTSTFGFGGKSIDPMHVTSHYIQTVVDYHIFGTEPLRLACLRAFNPEVSFHTEVYVVNEASVTRFVNATWRRRPDGVDIRCCDRIPKYLKTTLHENKLAIKFRCLHLDHGTSRNFYIYPLPNVSGVREFFVDGEGKRRHRFMVETT